MASVVGENCIKCKYTDCVEVCCADAFHEGPNFLVINPIDCLDCVLCQYECPTQAIFDEQEVPEGQVHFVALNAELSSIWPQISSQKLPMQGADEVIDQPNKLSELSAYSLSSVSEAFDRPRFLKESQTKNHVTDLYFYSRRLEYFQETFERKIFRTDEDRGKYNAFFVLDKNSFPFGANEAFFCLQCISYCSLNKIKLEQLTQQAAIEIYDLIWENIAAWQIQPLPEALASDKINLEPIYNSSKYSIHEKRIKNQYDPAPFPSALKIWNKVPRYLILVLNNPSQHTAFVELDDYFLWTHEWT